MASDGMTEVSARTSGNLSLFDRIRSLREFNGLSVRQLAKRTGIDYSNLSKYERGDRVPGLPVLEKIASGLGVGVDYFVKDSGEGDFSPKSLSGVIQQLREDKGWTQQELSEHAGLHRTYINKLEKDAVTPQVNTLTQIASAFGMSLQTLLNLSSVPRTFDPDQFVPFWAQLSSLLSDSLQIPLFLTNPSGSVLSANRAFTDLLGYIARPEALPLLSVISWLPYDSVPDSGECLAMIPSSNSAPFQRKISFKKVNAYSSPYDLYAKELIYGVISPEL